MDLIEAFKTVGFTKQETEIYLTLSEHGELSGYEAAKLSGISRSNAYATLSSLVDKGGAFTVEGQPKKYVATPKEELLLNAKRWFNKVINFIDKKVVYSPQKNEPYVTITRQEHIINKIQNMLLLTTQHLYFSADISIINLFLDTLKEIANHKKVVILCDEKITIPNIISYKTKTISSLKLIVDTNAVITGTLEQCLYSKSLTLVQLIREALMNEIKLIQYER
ncbi:MAG: TrmB family transcriptional regulator [Eubacteriales bacterium]